MSSQTYNRDAVVVNVGTGVKFLLELSVLVVRPAWSRDQFQCLPRAIGPSRSEPGSGEENSLDTTGVQSRLVYRRSSHCDV